jgi:two-component system sensor histidine kinase PilS (NtrC family)
MSEAIATTLRSEIDSSRAAVVGSTDDLPWRVLKLLNVSRWILGVALLLVFYAVDDPRIVATTYPRVGFAVLLTLIAFATVEFAILRRRIGQSRTHVYIQACVDIALIAVLMHASGGVSTGLGELLIISVGSLSLLLKADRAFFFAALATVALLAEQIVAQSQGLTGTAEFAQTGILGGVIFTIVGVTQLLRRRMVESEALAEQRGVDLRNLVELNEYIIQHLRESIVVVDGRDRIRLINESALKQLRAKEAYAGAPVREVSPTLAERLDAWRTRRSDQGSATPFQSDDGAARLEPHFARLGPDRNAGVLVFLEDTSLIAERVQQTKLAALGRLSASIAHEIRNPLGALSHAGQLLAESPSFTASEHRLAEIIRNNAQRVSNIVDSILALSRKDATEPQHLELRTWIESFAAEFTNTMELYEGSISVSPDARAVAVEMDPTHLHQIMWNLCDNAVKYASLEAGAIAVELRCGELESTGRPYLEVADRGAGIAADMVDQIFEPFFTAQKGGTGLGLYISRELCERNGGSLRYYPRSGGGSVFRIVFADPKRWRPTTDQT